MSVPVASFVLALVPIVVVFVFREMVVRRAAKMGRADEVGHSRWLFPTSVLLGGLGGFILGLAQPEPLTSWTRHLVQSADPVLVAQVVTGPFAEELGKGLLLGGLFLGARIRTWIGGLILGAGAGAGFATVENFFAFLLAYGEQGPEAWLAAVQVRLAASLLVHGVATALLGSTLGAARMQSRVWVKVLAIPVGLLLATAVHGSWNGMLLLAEETKIPPLAFLGAGAPLLAGSFLAAALYLALRRPAPAGLVSVSQQRQ